MKPALRFALPWLLYLALFPGCRCAGDSSLEPAQPVPKSGVFVRCPVCGLEFDQAEAIGTVEHQGKTYYFLLQDHLEAFRSQTIPSTRRGYSW